MPILCTVQGQSRRRVEKREEAGKGRGEEARGPRLGSVAGGCVRGRSREAADRPGSGDGKTSPGNGDYGRKDRRPEDCASGGRSGGGAGGRKAGRQDAVPQLRRAADPYAAALEADDAPNEKQQPQRPWGDHIGGAGGVPVPAPPDGVRLHELRGEMEKIMGMIRVLNIRRYRYEW